VVDLGVFLSPSGLGRWLEAEDLAGGDLEGLGDLVDGGRGRELGDDLTSRDCPLSLVPATPGACPASRFALK
jgi:hypothetical protein